MVGILVHSVPVWRSSDGLLSPAACCSPLQSRSSTRLLLRKTQGHKILSSRYGLWREGRLLHASISPLDFSEGTMVYVGDTLFSSSSIFLHSSGHRWRNKMNFVCAARAATRIEGTRFNRNCGGSVRSMSWYSETLADLVGGSPASLQFLNQYRKPSLISRTMLRSSNQQFETSTDGFSKPSQPSLLSSRNSGKKPDIESSQGSGKLPSAARSTRSEAPLKGSNRSSMESGSHLHNSELIEGQEFSRVSPKASKSEGNLPRSSKQSSRSSESVLEGTNSYHRKSSENAPSPRAPYFKTNSASYKAQILQAAKNKKQAATSFTSVLPSAKETPSNKGSATNSRNSQRSVSSSKNSQNPPSMLNRYRRTPFPSETPESKSSRGTEQLVVADNNGRLPNSGYFSATSDSSVVGITVSSSPGLPATGISSPDLVWPGTSADSLDSKNIAAERTDLSSASEHIASNPSTVRRNSRKESGSAVTGTESLDRLHQQLEDQSKGSGSKAILQKPLGAEEANRLKDRLIAQKRKGMQAIQQKISQGRQSRGDDDEFSCSVDPDTLILGEYVVHKRVGVGKFIGLKFEVPPGKERPAKYIYLKYADGIAKLKAKQAQRLLYRYHLPGETGRAPTLSKLKDPSLWEKRKSKGKIAIQKLVVNMMELYIHRLKQSRPPYPVNSPAMAAFAAKFPHVPTPDQQQAFIDVEKDMTERDLPMDRLICGDVGFGKTEVALRAILIAVIAGKQVMVLTPSTVLAKQHFETIRDRFAGFLGIKVALLCRFQKETEKKDLIVGIHDGSLSIVVGTHALLGNQIKYNNLGLLVIDEEQRFGVKQKEKITCLKTTVDVLTLSATPIPRTLYLAMSGFRDASLLTTPPPERRPIQTHLLEYNQETARKAIQFELDRGGQVFYVVPRVKGIEELQDLVQGQFPDIKVAIAHGKQSASALEEAMENFCEGETKILLCTNIIESGLDIRMVNTIIVEDVHLFGLAQLYQLRGRVGRAQREAHAYLFHPHKSLLTDEALERLVALEDCCDLGQGFQLAERDMAIRGIGSLFGEQQSGDAAKIGIDLYFEMLLEGLSKVDNQRLPQVDYDDVQLELGLDVHIPSEYIKRSEEREDVLKAAERAAKESLRSLMVFTNRLRDNFGKEPAAMEMLLKMLYVRRMAADLGIHRIRIRGLSVIMETNMSSEAFEMIASSITSESVRSSLTFDTGHIEMQGLIGLPQERQLERVFCCLVDMVNSLPSFVKYI
ncbi:transcription-repair coupling factor (superfamily II helicase) [Marchantia polymorpha subsp. ruderalis]|uniref:Uncharacterized protein n=1 Tax=Marchantia polymorpha TaxID=3197 RepID=A0A2R6XGE7_MARPO|nr:hypothetical protein MARPO_0015s0011 [Marchantia polymorpha]BBN01417.1 hypothetical protein Mp_2g07230 [Marchantia polymorpha subsp. ruderalis]|eukprot:PTQ45187.1 hypothetical protein MARPO_0015s0011 [Marchantia polymorpha]